MVTRTEFPDLEALRGELERQQHEALRQINDGLSQGKPDSGAEQWYSRVTRQWEQLNYVLNFFEMVRFRQSQNWQNWQTVAVIIVALLALVLSAFSVWRG